MDKNLKFDPDFAMEENDDPRTHGAYDAEESENSEEPEEVIEPEVRLDPEKVLDYYAELRTLINACGQVAYYYHMKHNLEDGEPDAIRVSISYKRNYLYYKNMHNKWRAKAKMSLRRIKLIASELGIEKFCDDDIILLNELALYPDRRECYRYYLKKYEKKCELHTIEDFEEKYRERLRKRLR